MPKPRHDPQTYIANKDGKAVIRIRTPHPNDVLSGRGGGINAHPGNKRFRDWVHVRKEAYNLAHSKQEKIQVSMEVIDLVRNLDPPGRFLAREENPHSGGGVTGFWIEIDENKAIAKTSQALREGAPRIKAEHGLSPFGGGGTRSRPTSAEKKSKRTHQERDATYSNLEASAKKLRPNIPILPQGAPSTVVNHTGSALQTQIHPKKLASPEEAVRALASAVKSAASHHDRQALLNGGQHMGPPMPRPSGTIASKLYGSKEAASKMVTAMQQQNIPGVGPSLSGPNIRTPVGNWYATATGGIKHNVPVIGQVPAVPLSVGPPNTPPLLAQSPRSSLCSSQEVKPVETAKAGVSFMRDTIEPLNGSNSSSNSSKHSVPFYRSHSLATSDDNFDPYGEEFRNPFDDELNGLGVAAESSPFSSAMLRNDSLRNLRLNSSEHSPLSHDSRNIKDSTKVGAQVSDDDSWRLGPSKSLSFIEMNDNSRHTPQLSKVEMQKLSEGKDKAKPTKDDSENEGEDEEKEKEEKTSNIEVARGNMEHGTEQSRLKGNEARRSGCGNDEIATEEQHHTSSTEDLKTSGAKNEDEKEGNPGPNIKSEGDTKGSEKKDEKTTEMTSKDPSLPSFGVERQKSNSSNLTNLSNMSQFSGLSTFSNLGSTASSLSRRLLGPSSSQRSSSKPKPPAEIKTC